MPKEEKLWLLRRKKVKKLNNTIPSTLNGKQNPEYFREYYAKNKDKVLAKNKETREKRKAKGIKNRVTAQTWRYMVVSLLKQRDGDKCALCGGLLNFNDIKSMHIDHIVPYAYSKNDNADNLQLSHKECNQRRSRKYGN
jgi:5-methylcytosine-specific restriction endonuclease McrA